MWHGNQDEAAGGGAKRFEIITVCTGNICRSPTAERLLRDRFAPFPQIRVGSAGVGALVGEPINVSMAHLLEQDDVNSEAFAARALTARLVREADLVLALSRRHRLHILEVAPAAVKRTFTLKEFARLSSQLRGQVPPGGPVERLPALVDLAARYRSPAPAGLDDIADPYGRDDVAFARAYAEIRSSVDLLVHAALDG